MNKQEPIHIAYVVGKMVTGGVQTVVLNYHKFIDRSKYQIDYFIDNDIEIDCEQEILELGGTIYSVPPYQNVVQYINTLRHIFKKNKYMIVHAHLNTLNIFPLFAAYLADVPIRISHNHSTSSKGEWKKNVMKQVLRPFSHVFVTDYFACSEHAGKWLFGKRSFNRGDIVVIQNGIDPIEFTFHQEIRNQMRENLNLSNNLVLGHVGRFCVAKNQAFIIDILKELKKHTSEFVFLFIGDGETLTEVKEKAKKADLEHHVRFLGSCKNVKDYMMMMDAFLFPSLYEGLGIVAIEAQYLGLPVIASDQVPEEARISQSITFIPLEKGVSEWVLQILNAVKMNRGTIEHSDFDIRHNAKKVVSLYDEMINKCKLKMDSR